MVNKRLTFIILIIIISSLSIKINGEDPAILAYDKYNNANDKIQELQNKGYPTLPLIDLIKISEEYYNNHNYNLSINKSNEVLQRSLEISDIKKNLSIATNNSNLLFRLGYDTANIELLLLYAKSDYEAANIDLAKKEIIELNKDILKVSKNYSSIFYNELSLYYKNYSEEEKTPEWLDIYYQKQIKYYKDNKYYDFLSGYDNFEIIKSILTEFNIFEDNKNNLFEKNISFNISKDMLTIINIYLNEGNFDKGLINIKNINALANQAIYLKNEIEITSKEINRLDELGIIDNKTIQLFNSSKKEFNLENFEESFKTLNLTKNSLKDIETENIILGGINKAMFKKSFKDYIKNNWPFLLLFSLFIIIIYRPIKIYIILKSFKYKLKKARQETEVISTLQLDLQKYYFIDKIINKKAYDSDFHTYEERKIELTNEITILNDSIDDYSKKFKNIFARYKEFFEKMKNMLKSNNNVNKISEKNDSAIK